MDKEMNLEVLKILANDQYIDEAYEIVGEFNVVIGLQSINIRITKDIDNKYYYKNSHHYKRSDLSGTNESSINGADSYKGAINYALIELTGVFDGKNDGEWTINPRY